MKMNVEKKESEKMIVNMKNVNNKKDVVIKSEVKKKVEKLNSELVNMLNSNEVKYKEMKESSGRLKIVNWMEVCDWCISMEWVNMNMIRDYVLSNYKKDKIYYSELLRFIRCEKINKVVKIVSKEIEYGEEKNVYYKFVKRV